MSVTILMYHMVAEPGNATEARLCRRPAAFRNDMLQIRTAGYQVLPLKQVLDGVSGKVKLPNKSVAITFDDGISCAFEKALPILQEYGYPATVFVVSGLIGKSNDWGNAFGLPPRRMLTHDEIRALACSGVDIGSHTVNHVWLGKSSPDAIVNEVRDSKAVLEDIIGREVPHFAYPFGSWNPTARNAIIEAGYEGACSTQSGRNREGSDPFLLRRSEIKGSDAPWQFRLKLTFATNSMPPTSDARRVVRQTFEKWGLRTPR